METGSAPVIEVEGLVKRFRSKTVLDGISFRVERGDIFGYLGPNGAGKTTTIRVLLGLVNPTAGRALVWGQDLGASAELRKKVGVLLERDGLYDRLTARQNLEYYASLYNIPAREQKIAALLESSGLASRADDRVGEFSRGMKRKLGLARAILPDPELLFLDEPSAGLDPEAQKVVRELLLRLSRQQGTTIFLNSHDLDEVQRVCTRVGIIQKGRLLACDTVENLRGETTRPVVAVTLSQPGEAQKACNLLQPLDYVTGCQAQDGQVYATLAGGTPPSQLLRFLVEKGVGVEEVKRVTRSLEDIYLDIMRQEAK